MHVYTYSWHARESQDSCHIVAYGIAENGDNVQLSFGYSPRCYVALPSIVWTEDKKKQLYAALAKKLRATRVDFVEMPKLYGGGVENGRWKTFPFLHCMFKSRRHMWVSAKCCECVNLPFLNVWGAKLEFHETGVHPIVQAVTACETYFTGWQTVPDECIKSRGTRTFGCVECELPSWRQLASCREKLPPPDPLVMSFDLETYSSDPLKFPSADVVEDCIFQISCIFKRGDGPSTSVLLCMIDCDPIEGVQVKTFHNEYTLLKGFVSLVTEKNPHVICGYNIMKFDLPYLIKRASLNMCLQEFKILGFPTRLGGDVVEKQWRSNAYGDQKYKFLDIEGRLYVDLNPFVEKNFKLENYKLSTVAREFLKDDKVDMDVSTMFRAFKTALKSRPGAAAAMADVGRYCVQDSLLVLRLFEKLQVWPSIVEMSRVVHCPIADILLRGEGIRVFSSIVKHCHQKMVVASPPQEKDSKYAGAYVFDPVPGMYDNVVPFDFASLYPSTIIAYNIDYASFVTDDGVPDSDCHVFRWEDHIGCEHDPRVIRLGETTDRAERAAVKKKMPQNVICAKRNFRFLKSPEGVLPSIVRGCLDARRETRRQLATVPKTSPDWTILNQRQLAYKVSANSIYGVTGQGVGKLPLVKLAMCITQKGRENVKRAADEMSRRFGARVLYGDTDSNYVTFPRLTSSKDVWDLAVRAAAEISSLFPQPLELEFEETIYAQFLILAKKKYVFRKMNRDGVVDGEIGKIGVVLNRRDNCKFIRDVYAILVDCVFDARRTSGTDASPIGDENSRDACRGGDACRCRWCIVYRLVLEFDRLETKRVTVRDLTMTKGCRDYGDGDHPVDDRLGAYKMRMLPDEPAEKTRKLGDRSEAEFYASQLPAAAQLKKRMERRGLRVTEGSRVEFVIVRYGGAKQGDNIEAVDYFVEFSRVLSIDTHYYMNLLVAPLDQILETCFGLRDVVKKHVQLRTQKRRVCESVLKLFASRWPGDAHTVEKGLVSVGSEPRIVKVRVWDIKRAAPASAGKCSAAVRR